MKIITLCTIMSLWLLSAVGVLAQETNAEQIEMLQALREEIVSEEKEALKEEVENIQQRLENEQLSYEEAENLKKEAAQKRALNIENRLAIVDNKIALLERNAEEETYSDDDDRVVLRIGSDDDDDTFIFLGKKNKERKYDRRTTSDFVLAVGFNNIITEGQSLNDSDFKLGGSRFAELGWAWKTRVFKNSNWLRVKYGFSFQFNGLKPTDNRYFVDMGDQTVLEEFPVELDKSKFRMDNLVIPIHFEIGPSKKIEKDTYFRYSTRDQIKFGFGGYAGIKLGARQKLKYEEDGQDIKEKLKGGYNTNNFIYGVSAYLGWRDTALYVKYDLNPIFKDNPVEQRNISLGLRFDMD
ncbi:hypothetical protein MG296_02110 [Flavobacteriaceae bacterium TK19130]|nr:hypothetical protein [Thermobacterium salinum]